MTEAQRDGIDGLWFRGLDEAAKLRMVEVLSGSSMVLDRERYIIEYLYRSAQSKSEDMVNPNWPVLMARQEGYKHALRDIYNLLPRPKGTKR